MTSLPESLAQVEALVRRRGYIAARSPSFTEESIQAAEAAFGQPFPLDLRCFFAWFDRDLWSHFVNPDRVRISDTGKVLTLKGDLITKGHPADTFADLLRIGPLNYAKSEHIADSDEFHITAFVESLQMLKRPEAWLTTTVIEFGASNYGEPLLYAVDPPDSPRGSVFTFTTDSDDRVWLADGLAQWLARMVVCDGVDYAFAPGSYRDLPRDIRQLYTAEFRSHNPHSSFFRRG